MDFSAEQKDELATMLEEKAGETRGATEASDERIVTALEKMAGTSPQPGEGFAKRVLGAVKNISGGGSGGGKELVSVSIPEKRHLRTDKRSTYHISVYYRGSQFRGKVQDLHCV